LLSRHLEETGSPKAEALLAEWDINKQRFVHIRPRLPADESVQSTTSDEEPAATSSES
jgi:glutamate synthase domain-containing protein 3